MSSQATINARRAVARAAGLCGTCMKQPVVAGFTRCEKCRASSQASAKRRRNAAQPMKRGPRRQLSPAALLCEARLNIRKRRAYRESPSVDCYGTVQHARRRAYDLDVHAEFLRLLAETGIAVEGA